MVRTSSVIACLVVASACGGGDKKPPAKPVAKAEKAAPRKETEADREKKRLAAAQEIVPDGSACLPASLKGESAPRLDVAAIGQDLVVCATDTKEDRLLGPVACWKVDLKADPIGLVYGPPAPLPGRGLSVRMTERCARGFCLPADANVDGEVAHITWNPDGTKVAVLAGDSVHVFDNASKAHERAFPIKGEKGVSNRPTAIHWVGGTIYVEGVDDGPASFVFAFTAEDGAPQGAIVPLGGTSPASTYSGSFSILDKDRVAVAEKGFSTVTTYEGGTGKRGKLVRKLAKPPCKAAELEAFWVGSGDVGDKCRAHMTRTFDHLVGATAVAGSKSFVVALRGERVGELGLLDLKTLAEKSSIKLPWCDAGKASDAGGE